MENPLVIVEQKFNEMAAALELKIKIEITEEFTAMLLSRLLTLNNNEKRQADYHAALGALGKNGD